MRPPRRLLAAVSALLGTAAALVAPALPSSADPPTVLYVNNVRDCDDSGSGGQSTPFCTMQAAADAAQPGQTVAVASNRDAYGAVTFTRSGTSAAPIAFVGMTSLGPSELGAGVPARLTGTVTFSGVHDVTFDGFTVQTTGDQAAVQVNGAQSVTLNRVGINFLAPQTAAEVGIAIDGGSSDVTVSRTAITTSSVGPAIHVAAGAARITVTTNHLASSATDAISLAGVTDAVITSNTVTNTNCGSAIAISGGSSAVVENNEIGIRTATTCTEPEAGLSVDSDAVDGVRCDYNSYYVVTPAVEYSWGDTAYGSVQTFHGATGQGQHDITVATFPVMGMAPERSPLIDSADADAPGELSTDFAGHQRIDDPLVTNTGVGDPIPDRGADERLDTLTLFDRVSAYTGQAPFAVTASLTSAPTSAWSEPVTVAVDFGDGSGAQPLSTDAPATHTYVTPGNYTATTTATDTSGIHLTHSFGITVTAPPPPPPPLSGAPTAISNGVSGSLEVWGNAGGSLIRRSYQYGWSAWNDFGGGLTGPVTVFNNHPLLGQTEVYANANGQLETSSWPNGIWSGWTNLGGTIAGTPATIQNPRYDTSEVYVQSGTHVMYKYLSGSTWSGWNDLGGNINGDPAVIYNPRFGSTEVYARSGTHIVYRYYLGSSWSGWIDLGGNVSGDPTVFYDSNSGETEIYVRSNDQLVTDVYSGTAWSGWKSLGGTVSGDPSVIFNPIYKTTEVYVRSGTHVAFTYLVGSTQGGWTDLGGNTSADPSVVFDGYSGNTEIFVNDNGDIDQKIYVTSSAQWGSWSDLYKQ